MPKYLAKASYTQAGLQGLLQEGGSARRDVVVAAAESVGAKIESFYYAFGDKDVYVTVETPDQATAISLVLRVAAGGAVSVETVVLIEPEEVDVAAGIDVAYRGAGG